MGCSGSKAAAQEPGEESQAEVRTVASMDGEDAVYAQAAFYNMLNNGHNAPFIRDPAYLILVDCRPLDAYDANHIWVARHISTFGDVVKMTDVDNVVFYDSDGRCDGPAHNASRIYQSCGNPAAADLSVFTEPDEPTRLSATGVDTTVKMLNGGFNDFIANYALLCVKEHMYEPRMLEGLRTLPAEVLHKQMYLGAVEHANDLQGLSGLGVTHIINVSAHKNTFASENFTYLKLNVPDTVQGKLKPYFESANAFIRECFDQGGKVFVHCHRGMSRSATICIAWLMFDQRVTLEDAYETCKASRNCIRPNDAFVDQLSNYEAELLGKKISNTERLYHL